MTRVTPVRTARGALALLAVATAVPSIGAAQRSTTPSAMSTSAKRSEWLLVNTVEQGWDSNVRYLSTADADYISQGRSALSVLHIRPRGRVAVRAAGALVRYRDLKDFNAFTYDLGLDGNRRFSAVVTGFAGVGYQKRLSTDVVGLAGLPLLALSNQTTFSAATGIERRISSTTTGSVEFGYSSTTFDTPALRPGNALTGKGQLRHLYGRRSAISLLTEVQDGASQGIPLAAQGLSAGWEPSLGQAQAKFVAGATRISTGAAARVIATGAAQLSDSVGRGILAAGVSRGVSQAFGIGQLLTNDVATLTYDFQARRGNFVTVAAALASSAPSAGAGTTFRSSSVTAGLRRVLRSGVTAGASASYRQRKDIAVASGLAANLALGYTLGSR
ncbi:MAG: hypothetical protein IT355_10105 [Gemmatimonadaceae bacterium]|nr:hypothetical protein [Gemmatimonadaceae bacterium]